MKNIFKPCVVGFILSWSALFMHAEVHAKQLCIAMLPGADDQATEVERREIKAGIDSHLHNLGFANPEEAYDLETSAVDALERCFHARARTVIVLAHGLPLGLKDAILMTKVNGQPTPIMEDRLLALLPESMTQSFVFMSCYADRLPKSYPRLFSWLQGHQKIFSLPPPSPSLTTKYNDPGLRDYMQTIEAAIRAILNDNVGLGTTDLR